MGGAENPRVALERGAGGVKANLSKVDEMLVQHARNADASSRLEGVPDSVALRNHCGGPWNTNTRTGEGNNEYNLP